MIKAVVYKYTCIPTGKVYIGQTQHEDDRRAKFKNFYQNYSGGKKLENAREKYCDLSKWRYKVLESKKFSDTPEGRLAARDYLNEKEIYYIDLYDSVSRGYNSTRGGPTVGNDNDERKRSNILSLRSSINKVLKYDLDDIVDSFGEENFVTLVDNIEKLTNKLKKIKPILVRKQSICNLVKLLNSDIFTLDFHILGDDLILGDDELFALTDFLKKLKKIINRDDIQEKCYCLDSNDFKEVWNEWESIYYEVDSCNVDFPSYNLNDAFSKIQTSLKIILRKINLDEELSKKV